MAALEEQVRQERKKLYKVILEPDSSDSIIIKGSVKIMAKVEQAIWSGSSQ